MSRIGVATAVAIGDRRSRGISWPGGFAAGQTADNRENKPSHLIRLRRLLLRLELRLARLRMAERKADTGDKIMLGGLVVKAGLADEDAAVILGILVLAAKALAGPDGDLARRRFRRAGDRAFSETKTEF